MIGYLARFGRREEKYVQDQHVRQCERNIVRRDPKNVRDVDLGNGQK